MARPTLHRHQTWHTAPREEAPFEFDSKHGGGLLTLFDNGEKLVIDVFRCDPTVEVRVPPENLVQRAPQFAADELELLRSLIEMDYDDPPELVQRVARKLADLKPERA